MLALLSIDVLERRREPCDIVEAGDERRTRTARRDENISRPCSAGEEAGGRPSGLTGLPAGSISFFQVLKFKTARHCPTFATYPCPGKQLPH